VAPVVEYLFCECLLCKCETLSSNCSLTKLIINKHPESLTKMIGVLYSIQDQCVKIGFLSNVQKPI
jgi:hypothetical protein